MRISDWLRSVVPVGTQRCRRQRSKRIHQRSRRCETLERRMLLSATNPLDLGTLAGSNGFRLDGIDAGDRSGFSVSSAGDVNGDDFDACGMTTNRLRRP